jgi:hypothetical protein
LTGAINTEDQLSNYAESRENFGEMGCVGSDRERDERCRHWNDAHETALRGMAELGWRIVACSNLRPFADSCADSVAAAPIHRRARWCSAFDQCDNGCSALHL